MSLAFDFETDQTNPAPSPWEGIGSYPTMFHPRHGHIDTGALTQLRTNVHDPHASWIDATGGALNPSHFAYFDSLIVPAGEFVGVVTVPCVSSRHPTFFSTDLLGGSSTFRCLALTGCSVLSDTAYIPTVPWNPFEGYERYSNPNWDGYGADPIGLLTLSAARLFLAMLPDTFGTPDIAPGADGTIGLEWAFDQGPLRKLFIDIGPGGVWKGFWRKASGEYKVLPEQKVTLDITEGLKRLFADLAS